MIGRYQMSDSNPYAPPRPDSKPEQQKPRRWHRPSILLFLALVAYGWFTGMLLKDSSVTADFQAGVLFLVNGLWLLAATVWSALTTRKNLPALASTIACFIQILIMIIMLGFDIGSRREVVMINGMIAGGFFILSLFLVPKRGQ